MRSQPRQFLKCSLHRRLLVIDRLDTLMEKSDEVILAGSSVRHAIAAGVSQALRELGNVMARTEPARILDAYSILAI